MRIDQTSQFEGLAYRVGLDKFQEAVISLHFMHRFSNDAGLDSYDENDFESRSLYIDAQDVLNTVVPILLNTADSSRHNRIAEAKRRARQNFAEYGLTGSEAVGPANIITEIIFDRQYSRDTRKYYSKLLLCQQIARRIAARAPIRMAIPALPFKISSPLKSRGGQPDLAEIGFMLSLYEIVSAIESIYREACPDLPGPLAEFAVVSDGSRFSGLVGEPESVLRNYRSQLVAWTQRLGIDGRVKIHDYGTLLRERLPAAIQHEKARIAEAAVVEYAETMWPIFDPYEIPTSLRLAAEVEPDPEHGNAEGRFASLLKSLIYTINYKALERIEWPDPSIRRRVYRELTGHIFEPYVRLSPEELLRAKAAMEAEAAPFLSDQAKECLRQAMLREVWDATIHYMAEIKSDRELAEEPILSCLPDHLRWTIHAKQGQIAIAVPTMLGLTVQAWAGTAVFKQAKGGMIKLCTLPVLALEGAGATPVRVRDAAGVLGIGDQPLFYIYPDIAFDDLRDFLARLATSLVRRRAG
jgi:hypothetical protein